MTDALDHLAGQGAVRPGLIGREEETTYNATLTDAYRQWCDERGINPIVSVSQGEPQQMEDRSAAMVADGQADAVVSLVAEGASVMAGVARAGKTVPDDVLVLSMSEGAVEEFTHPPGSVMSLCGDQSGRMVAKVFARGIASGEWPATIDLPYELIIRESSTRKV